MMDKRTLKLLRRALKERLRGVGSRLELVDPEQWPVDVEHGKRSRVWISKHYLVQGFDEPEGITRLSICRTSLNGAGEWADGLSWEELQQIKDELGFQDREAVEIFPPAAAVVNVANLRHLWVYPAGVRLPFSWFSCKLQDEEVES